MCPAGRLVGGDAVHHVRGQAQPPHVFRGALVVGQARGEELVLLPARAHADLGNWSCAREALVLAEREGEMADKRNELRELRELGLGILYMGLESGDDATLSAAAAVCRGLAAGEAEMLTKDEILRTLTA